MNSKLRYFQPLFSQKTGVLRPRVVTIVTSAFALCVTSMGLIGVPQASAATASVSYAATDDASISQAQPSANYGSAAQLVNNNTSHSALTPTASPTPTVSPSGNDPVIAAAGDIACAAGYTVTSTTCQHMQTSNLLSGAQAVLALGDLQYNSGSYSDFVASYNPTWGRFKAQTHPVLGNHEGGGSGYFQYWGSQAGAKGKGWYSYNVGSWHILAINSNQCALSGCNAGSEQEQWVKADLAAHPAQCTLAYWHQPRWASGSTMGDNAYMSTIYSDLYNGNVDLLLAGHNHAYERFQPMNPSGGVDQARGIQEIIVGTGGKDHAGGTALRANSVLRNSSTFGVLNVTLHSSSYDFKFQPIAGASFSDSGSRACH